MKHSPAEILRAYLVASGNAQLPTTAGATWPISVGSLPDAPDQHLCIYDTAGKLDGRIQETGETQQKPGFQIRARAGTFQKAYQKLELLLSVCDTVNQQAVALETKNYLIHSVTLTSPILHLGQEEGKTRTSFTLNGLLTITEILP